MTTKNKIDPSILFSQCEFFIDYRSSQTGCDRSLRLGDQLEKKYGAKIVEQPHIHTTTHIIFKNGNVETKLFAKKYNKPLIDPMWLEHSIKKRRLVNYEKYRVDPDENLPPTADFDRLVISNKDIMPPSTPKNKLEHIQDGNVDSAKKTKRVLYTPKHGEFDQGKPDEYFDHQIRIITLENLGMNLPENNHMLINRYGCSVARRQIQENAANKSELKIEQSEKLQQDELPTTISIPSQSVPVIHFANTAREKRKSPVDIIGSPSTSFDFDSQKQYEALGNRPQSTPISSPLLRPKLSSNKNDKNQEIEIIREENLRDKQAITPLKTADYSSFTNVTPLNQINTKGKSRIRFQTCEVDEDNVNQQLPLANIEEVTESENTIPRPPPLLALSQGIRTKHPERLIDTKLNDPLPSIEDLPNAPANYSFVFYGFTLTHLEEAKRLARRMGDCFSSETIDMTTTHIVLPEDDVQMAIKIDLLLGLIYGCRFVTFEWLKSSSRIGEWLSVNKFEPKQFFLANPSLNIYRKSRQQQKPIQLFNDCGLIYLTSIAKERPLLLKLITLLGGNITVNRNQAKVVIGYSSKTLPIIIYPQVNEKWVIDSIKAGECLPPDNYLIDNNN